MTNFERVYLMSKPRKIAVSYADGRPDEVVDLNPLSNNPMLMQQQYRELDRQSQELDKAINKFNSLIVELEKYKANMSLSIKNQAEKEIQALLDSISTLGK